tara:strand:+ start:735 stop:1172 length:438 start_codon:yes stop_codon:yes gene_type:complete
MSLHQDDIDAVLYFLTEELNVDVVFDNDEPNAYWNSDRGIVSISTKQSKRLQLYTVLHEAGHAILRAGEFYDVRFPYGDKHQNKSIARRVDVIREEVMAWDEGEKLAFSLGITLDLKLWHNFVKKNLFDYVRWAYDPEAFYDSRQ